MFLHFFWGGISLFLWHFFSVSDVFFFLASNSGDFFLGSGVVLVIVSPSDRLVLLLDGAGQAAGEDDADELPKKRI